MPDDGEPLRPRDVLTSVRAERLPVRVDPEHVFASLFAAEAHAFWLDAGIRHERGVSYLGAASPSRPSYLVHEGRLQRLRRGAAGDETVPVDGTLAEALRSWRAPTGGGSRDGDPGRSPLGWVGWFGYEYGAGRAGVPTTPSPYPDAALLAADRLIAIDGESSQPVLWFLNDESGREWASRTAFRLRALAEDDARPEGHPVEPLSEASPPRWRNSDDDYLRMIEACQRAIRAGDAYQLCLTTSVSVQTEVDPFEVYRRVRRNSLAERGGYLRVGDVAMLSASPELFLEVSDGVAVTRPVKGTRRRGSTEEEDAALRDVLAADAKERAENLMIVDLMRNDLSRVSRLGGVSVTGLLEVETHAHVHQLASTIRAELAAGTDALDVLDACFPAGSMTGAPKISAMRILHELERAPRGIYSGCFGRLGLDGSAELAMVIRTIVMSGGEATIGTGGGITALSVPANELAEVKLKAAALLAALGA